MPFVTVFFISLAKRSGLDLGTFWHAMRASVGTSFTWETAGPNIMNGDYHPEFPLDLQCKDIHLFYQMAKDAKVGRKYCSLYKI